MSNCFRTSDNKYNDAPPRMADGRHFTDYRPSCDLNNDVRRDNQIVDSFESRLFLQRNANQLMNINRNKACDKNCSSVCADDVNDDVQNEGFTSTMLPELNKQICNDTYCKVIQNNPNGLGLGRHYFNVEQEEEYEKNMSSVGDNSCGVSNSFLNNYYSNIDNKEGFMDNGNEYSLEYGITNANIIIKQLTQELIKLNNDYKSNEKRLEQIKNDLNSLPERKQKMNEDLIEKRKEINKTTIQLNNARSRLIELNEELNKNRKLLVKAAQEEQAEEVEREQNNILNSIKNSVENRTNNNPESINEPHTPNEPQTPSSNRQPSNERSTLSNQGATLSNNQQTSNEPQPLSNKRSQSPKVNNLFDSFKRLSDEEQERLRNMLMEKPL
jgi:hypothetical protein